MPGRTTALKTARSSFRKPFYDKQWKRWRFQRRDLTTGKTSTITLEAEGKDEATNEWHELYEQEKKDIAEEKKPPRERELVSLELEQAIAQYLDTVEVRRPTLRDYQITLRKFSDEMKLLGRTWCHEVTLKDIEQLFHKNGEWGQLTGRTKEKHRGTIQRLFKWCKKHHHVRENVVKNHDVPTKWRKEIRRGLREWGQALTVEQAQKLLRAAESPPAAPWLFLAVLIPLRAGLRAGNVLGLKWRHVKDSRGVLSFPGSEMKNDEALELPIHPELAYYLRKHLNQQKRELGRAPKPDDKVLNTRGNNVRRTLLAAAKRAGLELERPLSYHHLRHTFCTWLERKCTFAAARQLMGHTPGNVTQGYTHPSLSELREEVEKLEWLTEKRARANRASRS